MEDLRETLLYQGWELAIEYVSRQYTGDLWVDQGIGYVLFAREHSRLFNCLHHGPVQDIRQRRYQFWLHVSNAVKSLPAFQGMDPVRAGWIRHIRALLTHGIAVSVSSGLTPIWEDQDVIQEMLKLCSEVLYEGLSSRGDRLDAILDGIGPEARARISGGQDADTNPGRSGP